MVGKCVEREKRPQAGDWEEKAEYSCVYCYIKRPPKMQRLSGRLQESNHRESLLRTCRIYQVAYSAHSVHRDQRMRQVVAYKRLKTMENH